MVRLKATTIVAMFIILFCFQIGINKMYELSYQKELSENPIYYQKDGKWYQSSFGNEIKEIELPENFKVYTILKDNETLKWIGVFEKGDDEKLLVEFDVDQNYMETICTEAKLAESGIDIELISQIQYQKGSNNISFVCENFLYLYDRQRSEVKILCNQILPHESYRKEYSYLWSDNKNFYYIDKNSYKIQLYNYETHEEYDLVQDAYGLYGLSLKGNDLIYMDGGRHEFMAYVVYNGVYVLDINSGRNKKLYEYYGGTLIIDIHASTKAMILRNISREKTHNNIFYFQRFTYWAPKLKIGESGGEIQQIFWP